MIRGDFVEVHKDAKSSLILPHHNTDSAERQRKLDLEKYNYIGLVCKINDYNKDKIVVYVYRSEQKYIGIR